MNEMVKIQHQQWARDLDDQRRSGLTEDSCQNCTTVPVNGYRNS